MQSSAETQQRVDFIFEYLLNKRRRYDGNSLVSLAVKLESPHALDFLLSHPDRWRVDLKSKNREGLAPIHMAVKQKSIAMFDLIAKHSAQLILPVGLQFANPTTVNINMYEDTITLIANLQEDGGISSETIL